MELLATNIDKVFENIKKARKVTVGQLAKDLTMEPAVVTKICRYLELSELLSINFQHLGSPLVTFVQEPHVPFDDMDETELINRMKFYKSTQDVKSANKLVMDLYNYVKRLKDPDATDVYNKVLDYYEKHFLKDVEGEEKGVTKLDTYNFDVEDLNVGVDIIKQPLEPVPYYLLSLLKVSDVTYEVIDRIKEEVVAEITRNAAKVAQQKEMQLRHEFEKLVTALISEVFTYFTEEQREIFTQYIIITSLGMGEVEFLLHDAQLEEIVINNAYEPVRVYHKKYGWMQTDIIAESENRIVHFATLAGRNVEKTITTLYPLMDAHLKTGDRVNATLKPISSKGSTITIRKFSESPWTITDFLKSGTIDYQTAAMVWTAIQYELSVLIVGGTGSGKTSTLNVFSLFIVPSQRIVSIEDTRELRLPSTLHWVPMETRMANPEGRGEVSMLDLVVNALRMRPDRIVVGEIRRKKEAEVLFEAMHTGHSVYATLHANTVQEAVVRLTTEPIGISKTLLGALDLIIVQNRNRRTNERRTFQLAELNLEGDANVLYNYKFKTDKLEQANEPKEFYERLELFSGLTKKEVNASVADKVKILKYLVENDIRSIEEIGSIISYYYTDRDYLMKRLFGK